ncbi:MAG: hypothetical protein ACRCV9_02940 [Burkholderiaceae bacterium]
MRTRNAGFAASSLVVVLLVALSGCGGSSEPTDAGQPPAPVAGVTPTPAASPTPGSTASPTPAGTTSPAPSASPVPGGPVGDPVLPPPVTPPTIAPPNLSAEQRQQYVAGLTVWRKPGHPDASKGASCAQCHSPDGIELARYNFTDNDILRRAKPHLEDKDAQAVLAFIKLQRDIYKLNGKLLDPMEDRPFQPGGKPIEGATAPQRDYNATKQVYAVKMPTLFSGRIDTPEKAAKARDEILNFNLRTERNPVPCARLAEDIFHGKEHGDTNDWLPEFPNFAKTAAQQTAWFKLQDEYLTNPTEENLYEMISAATEVFEHYNNPDLPENFPRKVAVRKYMALLLGQHLFRREAMGDRTMSDTYMTGENYYKHRYMHRENPSKPSLDLANFFFEVGDVVKTGIDDNKLELVNSPESRSKHNPDVPLGQMYRKMDVPWWVCGQTFNAHLPTSGSNRQEYYPSGLGGSRSPSRGGNGTTAPYAVAESFTRMKMEVEASFRPQKTAADKPATTPVVGTNDLYHLGFASLGNDAVCDDATKCKFVNEEHRQLHHTFDANVERMQLFLMRDTLAKQCKKDDKSLVKKVIQNETSEWLPGVEEKLLPNLTRFDPQNAAADTALVRGTRDLFEKAWAGCIESLPPLGNGNGVKLEVFAGKSFTGTPVTSKNVSRVALYAADVKSNSYAARWSGKMQARFGGEHSFGSAGVNSFAIYRLFINGKQVFGPELGGENTRSGKMVLEAGKQYDFSFELVADDLPYYNYTLGWSSNQFPFQYLPASQLYTN